MGVIIATSSSFRRQSTYHCAGSTSSLATSQLRAFEVWLCPDEVEQGPVWVGVAEDSLFPVDEAADV